MNHNRIVSAVSLFVVALVAIAPAQAAVLDLTTVGSSGTIGGALFVQGSLATATGTGLINTFLKLETPKTGVVEAGYNTDGQEEFQTAKAWTKSIQLKDIPQTVIGGVTYRAFLLDLNQTTGSAPMSLNNLRFHVEGSGDLTGYPSSFTSAVYDMNLGGGTNNVLLDASIHPGSGTSDMFALIPSELFGATETKYVYLYSEFSGANDGFDEWAAQKTTSNPIITVDPLRIVKFLDANGNGLPDTGEGPLNGWQFDVSGGNLGSEVRHLTTGSDGLTGPTDLTNGVTYLITEVGILDGWHQTTNGGNPISVTMNGPTDVYVGNNIPEPATLSVLILGGIAALLRRRR